VFISVFVSVLFTTSVLESLLWLILLVVGFSILGLYHFILSRHVRDFILQLAQLVEGVGARLGA